MSDRPRRALRAIQFSPVVAITLLIAAWFAVPAELSSLMLSTEAVFSASDPPNALGDEEVRAMLVDSYLENERLLALDVQGSEASLDTVTRSVWHDLALAQDDYIVSDTIVPFGLERDDALFDPLAEWEARNDAEVWIWALPYPSQPSPVIVFIPESARKPASVLKDHWSTPDQQKAEYPADVSDEELAEIMWNSGGVVGATSLPPLSASSVTGSGGGWGDDDVAVGEHSAAHDSGIYRYYLIGTNDPVTHMAPSAWTLPFELMTTDPRDPSFEDVVQQVGERESLGIVVLGPAVYEAIPVRAARGVAIEDADKVGNALWPEYLLPPAPTGEAYEQPYLRSMFVKLEEPVATHTGSHIGVLLPVSSFEGIDGPWDSPPTKPGQHLPQTLLFLATWSDSSFAATEPSLASLQGVQWWAARNLPLPWLLGATATLLAVSFIASPLAFVYERRRAMREQALEEMSRMRRDAHDRVYNRLSALSKQVALSADDTENAAGGRLGRVAEEIRGAVGELQAILGDEGVHRSTTLTSQPLGAQLEQVCSAQASLLGIEVDCTIDVDTEIPDVPPALGWDLQCITEEAVTNAVRHGGATGVAVTLAAGTAAGASDRTLLLTVSDNGSGSAVFSADDAASGSTGLRGMQTRAERWGGDVRLASTGEGATLTVRVTVPPAE